MYSQLIYNYFNLTKFIQRSRGKYFSITVPEKHSFTCFETKRCSGNQLFNIKPHSIQFWLSFRSINNLAPESLFCGTETETLISSLELYVSACSGLGFLTKRLNVPGKYRRNGRSRRVRPHLETKGLDFI